MHKYIMFCLGILQFALISTVIATPTSRSSQRDVSLESATAVSTLPDLPQDEDLATAATFYAYHLPDVAVLMAAITAMRELGLRAFETDTLPETSWSHPSFPGVRLTVRPPVGKTRLSVRFAMWMILYSTRCMVVEKMYSGQFLSIYKTEVIGFVNTLPTAAIIVRQGDLSTQRTKHVDTRSIPFNASAQSFTMGEIANDDMQANVDWVGKTIDRADFFLALLWLIVDLAPHNGEPLTVWQVTRSAMNCQVTTIWNRIKPPAGSPQYPISKGDLISMLAYLPEVSLRDRRFQEMNVEISERGQLIARGLVRTKPLLGLPSGPLIMNNTIA